MIKKESKKVRNIYGEFGHVRLSADEVEKLNHDFGEELTQSSITFLDEYIEMKGYKAKNHYLCIRKWVVDAVKKKKSTNNLDDAYEMMRKWAEEGT